MTTIPKTQHIKLNFPPKVLNVSVQSIAGTEYWPYQNSPDDPWYAGSPSKRYYRWQITMSVETKLHGSNLTREPFRFNGLDVSVGDWIAGATDGKCLKIISVLAKTKTSVTCIVEDHLRFNTFNASNGDGMINGGSAVIFTLSEEGYPILDYSVSTNPEFFLLVYSRFQYLNPQTNYVLYQPDHEFVKGDVVSVINTGYVKSNIETAATMIGVVTENAIGPDYFIISPNNRITDFDPGIPGRRGEYIFIDDNGSLSNVSTASRKAVFLNVREAIPTMLTGTVENPVIGNGNTILLNGVSITFSSPGGSSNAAEIAAQINAQTNTHFVTATAVNSPTVVEATEGFNSNYGLMGGYVPFSAYINNTVSNVLVNFTSSGSEFPGVATAGDLKADIDAASIPGIETVINGNELVIKEVNGNSIRITNVTNDTNGVPFAGPNSITGFATFTSGSVGQSLTLIRSDGGEILITEPSEVFQLATGIFSGHNGSLPLAMNIEQGVYNGGIYVVADIPARNALSPIIGDQAFVISKEDGEWGLYQYTGAIWVEVSNHDSATTDAKTLTAQFTMPAGSSDPIVVTLGNISPGRKIVEVTVDVTQAFSGYTSLPDVNVGSNVTPDLLANGDLSDLLQIGKYQTSSEYIYPSANTQDLDVTATLNHYGATAGIVEIRITYV